MKTKGVLVKTLFRVLTSLHSPVCSYHAVNLTQSYLLPGLLICLKSLSRPLFWASVAPRLPPNLPVQPRLPHSQHSPLFQNPGEVVAIPSAHIQTKMFHVSMPLVTVLTVLSPLLLFPLCWTNSP